MQEEIFRKKSLDKIQSPEDLNDYVRVANPGLWLVLAAVIILLVGACVWGICGRIESTLPVTAEVSSGMAVCSYSDSGKMEPEAGMVLRIGDENFTLQSADPASGSAAGIVSLPDGFYEGEIVLESISPLSFLFD